jgi:CheY-like chemotaxis protein
MTQRRPAILARRRVADPDAPRVWSVEERELSDGRALFFVDDVSFIRIRHYPTNWLELAAKDLLALRTDPCARPRHNAPSTSTETIRRRVLVIDDDAAARYVAHRTLQSLTDDIFEADNAAAGVELARMVKPDLILLDYVMPGVTGGEAIRLIKSDPALRHVPILLYTAYAENVDNDAKSSVDAILEKHDFDRDRALQLVMNFLETGR